MQAYGWAELVAASAFWNMLPRARGQMLGGNRQSCGFEHLHATSNLALGGRRTVAPAHQ